MTPSLRRRLLITLITTTALAWLAGAIVSYYDAQHEVEELFDAQLAKSAKVLLLFTTHELEEQRTFVGTTTLTESASQKLWDKIGHPYEHKFKLAIQVWVSRSELALRLKNAPLSPMTAQDNGYSQATIGGRPWRVFSIFDPEHQIQIQIAQSYAIRHELINRIALRVLGPVFLVMPLLALLIWYSVGRSMEPLNRLAKEVQNRKPSQLQPIEDRRAPQEIRPLLGALNNLFRRLQNAFENEHRFTADAAHELRTPLAGLRTQAQVALRATDDAARSEALAQLNRAAERTSHLVSQMLTLARLDPETGIAALHPVNLGEVTAAVVADLAPAALEKEIEITLTDQCGRKIDGDADAIAILVRNIVHNAINYTPRKGSIEVRIEATSERAVLSVADSGSGIPLSERERVFERFYRSPGVHEEGSGLGFSIIRRIAEIHHAELYLGTSRFNGLWVEVRFPLRSAGQDHPES